MTSQTLPRRATRFTNVCAGNFSRSGSTHSSPPHLTVGTIKKKGLEKEVHFVQKFDRGEVIKNLIY